MPVQKSQSGLLAKLGNRLAGAHNEHKNDDTNYGQMELPAGLENAVAQLVDCKFTQIKADAKEGAGEYMFYAAGVVKSPKEFNGVPVEGMRTQISEPLYDTPSRTRKTLSEHVGWVYNELRKLGVDTKVVQPENLEAIAAALKKAQPHFKFRTWKGDKQTTGPYAGKEPRVNHQWNGVCEYSGGSEDGGVVDDTGDAGTHYGSPETFPDHYAPTDNGSTGGPTRTAAATNPGDDLDTLAKAATPVEEGGGGSAEAGDKLAEIAKARGVSEAQIETATSWAEVVKMIRGGGGSSSAPSVTVDDAGAAADWKPEKGDVYKFSPVDPKTKKPVKKAVEVVVESVDVTTKKVTLKNLDNPKLIYNGVDWDKLESAT